MFGDLKVPSSNNSRIYCFLVIAGIAVSFNPLALAFGMVPYNAWMNHKEFISFII
jgi:hypothetical protein